MTPRYNPLLAQDVIELSGGNIAAGKIPFLWFVLLFGCLIAFARFATKIRWEARALWLWATWSALCLLQWPGLSFGDMQRAYQASGGQALAALVLPPLILYFMGPIVRDRLLFGAAKWMVIFEIGALWAERAGAFLHFSALQKWGENGGLLLAPSFGTALIALYLPFARGYLLWASLITIFSFRGSTALLMLLAIVLAFGFKRLPHQWFWAPAALFLPVLLCIALLRANAPMLDGLERLKGYRIYMGFWSQVLEAIAVGFGPGSFKWIAYSLPDPDRPLADYLHSDWLQIFFELGIMGGVLSILTYWRALVMARRDEQVFLAVAAAGAFAITYHPLHMAPTAFLLCLIFMKALTPPTEGPCVREFYDRYAAGE